MYQSCQSVELKCSVCWFQDDIEALIAEFAAKDKKRQAVQEEKVEPPSPRYQGLFHKDS